MKKKKEKKKYYCIIVCLCVCKNVYGWGLTNPLRSCKANEELVATQKNR